MDRIYIYGWLLSHKEGGYWTLSSKIDGARVVIYIGKTTTLVRINSAIDKFCRIRRLDRKKIFSKEVDAPPRVIAVKKMYKGWSVYRSKERVNPANRYAAPCFGAKYYSFDVSVDTRGSNVDKRILKYLQRFNPHLELERIPQDREELREFFKRYPRHENIQTVQN